MSQFQADAPVNVPAESQAPQSHKPSTRKESKRSEPLERRLLRTSHAAQYLGISSWQLRELVRDGKLPVVRHDPRGPWWIDIGDLDEYITAHKQVL